MIKIVEMEEQINHNEPIELLRNYGVSNESMCKFNICYENDTKATTYNRIIFPVYDADGNKCGMISRRINRDDGAVYINHTNNVYFYGLNFAINSSEDSFILCEGVIDTILLQQNGFDNAIGCLKTSISDDAILQLKKYKSKVYIAFDNDNYGRKCAQKLADIFASAGMEALIIDFGKYKDSLHKELNR